MFHEKDSDPIAAILDSPAAPSMVARLISEMDIERQRRLQFYHDIDDDMKIEFINGEIIAHSPVKKQHTDVVGALFHLLDYFARLAKLGWVGYEKVMSAFTRNDYEPDVVFFGNEKSAAFQKSQWKFPVPDFVVEVLSEGTKDRDRGIKFRDYEAHGVQEYWIIDPESESIEQYFLHDGKFKLHLKAGRGLIESRAVPGFSIEIRAVFDEKANLEALRQIIGH